MDLACLMPVRNEGWILGLSLRAALMWCDRAVVLNHASTDDTAEILEQISREYPVRVTVLTEPDPTWREMSHRQRLLEEARRLGSTHMAIVDADEVLTGTMLPFIREQVESLPPGGYLHVAWLAMWQSAYRYRDDDTIWGKRSIVTAAFHDRPVLGWRTDAKGYDFHHRDPYGSRLAGRISRDCGGLMHLQFASRRRLLAKHALYKITETVRWSDFRSAADIDKLYSLAPNEKGAMTEDAPAEWWEPYKHLLKYMHIDATPWQEAACREMVAAHGREKFAGLDLFGVA